MSDSSWLSLSVDGLGQKPAVFSFDLSEGILGSDLLTASFLARSIPSGSVIGSDASFSFEFGGRKEHFNGIGHVPLRPGMSFDASGETFVVFSASHTGSQAAAFGIKDKDEGYTCRVMAFSKRILASLPRRNAKPQVPGVIVAKVEGFKNSPAAIDSEGRYIVRMPFDDENPDMASSTPVHLAQSFAGEGCGVHFPLRKGTPVLIAFEDGDIDKPVALGALPIGSCSGPASHEKSFQNILKTVSGMKLVLDDKAGSLDIDAPGSISLMSGGRLDLESDELSIEGREKAVLRTAGGLQITLDGSSGVLTVESPGDIVLDAGGSIVLDACSVEIGDGSKSRLCRLRRGCIMVAKKLKCFCCSCHYIMNGWLIHHKGKYRNFCYNCGCDLHKAG